MSTVLLQLVGVMLHFLIVHTVACSALALLGSGAYWHLGIVLLSAMIAFYSIRKTIHNAILFVLLHVGVFVALAFLSGGILRLIEWVCLGFTLFDSILLRYRNAEYKGFGSVSALVFAGCYMLAAYFGKSNVMTLCLIESLFFIGFKIVFDGFSNIKEFFELNHRVAQMPVQLIRKRTGIFVGVFVAFVVVGMLFGIGSGLDVLIEKLGAFLAGVMHSMVGVKKEIVPQQADFSVFSDTPLPDVSGLHIATGKSLNPIFAVLGKIFIRISLVAVGLYILRSLYLKLRYFLKDLNDERNEHEVSEYIAPIREQFTAVIRNRLRFSDVKDTYPNNAKIRKLYKKYIGKHKTQELNKCLSPYEISEELGVHSSKQDIEVRTLYEKAKYGQNECTQDEVKEMKNLLRTKVERSQNGA